MTENELMKAAEHKAVAWRASRANPTFITKQDLVRVLHDFAREMLIDNDAATREQREALNLNASRGGMKL